MAERRKLIECLRRHHIRRQAVRTMETALEVLTPEERLVAEHILIAPYKGNIRRVSEILDVEESTVYRYKYQVMEKLVKILDLEEQ